LSHEKTKKFIKKRLLDIPTEEKRGGGEGKRRGKEEEEKKKKKRGRKVEYIAIYDGTITY